MSVPHAGGSSLAGPPPPDWSPPAALARLVGARPHEFIWVNGLGGVTVRVGGPRPAYLKWLPRSSGLVVSDEVARLRWAAPQVAVPTVLDEGEDDEATWFASAVIDAENAVSDRWRREPSRAATAVGAGLRAFHDSLDIGTCPFDWSVGLRVERVAARLASESPDTAWRSQTGDLDQSSTLRVLHAPPPEDRVVAQGDACLPNTLLDAEGRCVAHVDLGYLGVADRWSDVAVAAWSTEWNFGAGYADALYEGYGLEPDRETIDFYRLLWEME